MCLSELINLNSNEAKAKPLFKRAKKALRPGTPLGDFGHAVYPFTQSERCSMVYNFRVHGIRQVFHGSPNILNFSRSARRYDLHSRAR